MKENVLSRDETRRSLKNHQGEKSVNFRSYTSQLEYVFQLEKNVPYAKTH